MIFRPVTLQEANLFLPLLQEHFSRIHVLVSEGQALQEKIVKQTQVQPSDSGDYIVFHDNEKLRDNLEDIESKIRTEMWEMQQYGAIVKSIFPVRVDFLSERHKQPVYLSWQAGDAYVGHWRLTDEVFGVRRLI